MQNLQFFTGPQATTGAEKMIELEILAFIWLTGLAVIRIGEVLKKARTENESDNFRNC